jgi:hypothetical protein
MKTDTNSDPTRFICTKGEIITITFAPNVSDALHITFCLKADCNKTDQKPVVGNQISFPVLEKKFPLNLFFFFKPGSPLGSCEILFNSSNGDSFHEPLPAEEDTTGLLTRKIYHFVIE